MITSNNGHLSPSDYLTRTNLRGIVFIGAGLVALAIPTASQFLLALTVAIVLVLNGATDLYASLTAKPTKWTRVLLGALYMVAGLGLMISTDRTIRALTVFIGLIAIVRGVAVGASALHARKARPTWTFDIIRGLLFVAVGGIVITLPETVIAGLIFAAAGTAIVVGAITLSFGITHIEDDEADILEIGGYVKAWLDERDLGDEMRDELVDNLYFEPPGAVQKQAGFWVLLVLSVAIATLGIIADSTAVVIGAMLVAPLMTPIMGVSAGIVNGWPRRVSTAFATVTGGVAVSVGVAWIVASWTPQLIPLSSNTQVLSRISPTLVDMMIAVAAGAAGAYATVDRRVSSSIIGVAIAVALVPPLGVVGITLKAGQFSDAGGAFLLFLTNLVSIILVASVVFVVTGLVPIEQFKANRQTMRTVISTVTLGALVIMVPLIFAAEGIIASATRQATARSVTETWLGDQEGLSLKKVEVKTNDVTVVITGEGNVPPVEDLRVGLEEEFKTRIFVVVEYFPSVKLSSGGP